MMEGLRIILLPFWPYLAACLVFGVLFGVIGWRERPAGFFGRLGLILVVLGLLGAAALAVLGRVPGRPGLWLEIGLASTLAYIAGSVLGSVIRGALRRDGTNAEAGVPAG